MTKAQELLTEFDLEMASARKAIERVPSDKGEWKPHPKSFSLSHLTQLVSSMPGWIRDTLREPAIDLAKSEGYSTQPTATLLDQFDTNVKEAREALQKASDEDWNAQWQLKMGEHVLITSPKGVAVRQHISHFVHHRAQLGVYLRLLDLPVPCTYGPTADERMF